jgi:hypothetical protein
MGEAPFLLKTIKAMFENKGFLDKRNFRKGLIFWECCGIMSASGMIHQTGNGVVLFGRRSFCYGI